MVEILKLFHIESVPLPVLLLLAVVVVIAIIVLLKMLGITKTILGPGGITIDFGNKKEETEKTKKIETKTAEKFKHILFYTSPSDHPDYTKFMNSLTVFIETQKEILRTCIDDNGYASMDDATWKDYRSKQIEPYKSAMYDWFMLKNNNQVLEEFYKSKLFNYQYSSISGTDQLFDTFIHEVLTLMFNDMKKQAEKILKEINELEDKLKIDFMNSVQHLIDELKHFYNDDDTINLEIFSEHIQTEFSKYVDVKIKINNLKKIDYIKSQMDIVDDTHKYIKTIISKAFLVFIGNQMV